MLRDASINQLYYDRFMPRNLLLAAPSEITIEPAQRRYRIILIIAVTILSTLVTSLQTPASMRAAELRLYTTSQATNNLIAADIRQELDQQLSKISQIEAAERTTGQTVTDPQMIQEMVSSIQIDLAAGNFRGSRFELGELSGKLATWQQQIDNAVAAKNKIPPGPVVGVVNAPILMYHKTPTDFERQLQFLRDRGYETIDFDQLVAAFTTGTTLPPKPVIITFDDGFSDQMKAFELLRKYKMKATFYIVNAGQSSNYCIGAGRKYDQGYSCGDGYLNWDEIRALDKSGFVTIASHTINHLNLVTLPAELKRQEIILGKKDLEAKLGRTVRHFAYPYGSYNASISAIVREAGFVTAVSTKPGSIHTPGDLLALKRVRSAYKLP